MKQFTKAQYEKLLKNGSDPDKDHPPAIKLFTSDAQCTWLISEINPDDPDTAFGLCDLGFGEPELGYQSLTQSDFAPSAEDEEVRKLRSFFFGHMRGEGGDHLVTPLCQIISLALKAM